MKDSLRMKGVGAAVLGLGLLLGAGYLCHSRSVIPASSACYDLLAESLETARTRDGVIVPVFDPAKLTHIRCAATPGFVQFEVLGTDASGDTFRIYELSGGRAASGADTIFNYCYQQDGILRSGTRITGRDGTISDPVCKYDDSF